MSLPVSPCDAAPASLSDTAPDTPLDTAPETAPDPASEAPPLSLRQEAFCRHYAATGNAAGAARQAGYAEGSARQTGHELLERPAVAGRVCAIRQAWRATARTEAQILLGRLEQAWDAAVAKGSASLMLRVVKMQAELSGLDRRTAGRRAGLWPLPDEEGSNEEEAVVPAALVPPGPLAMALRHGRDRAGRALAQHRAQRKALERRADFDPDTHLADHLATACTLHNAVEERRRLGPETGSGASAMTDHYISLHAADRAMERDSAIDRDRTDLHPIDLRPIDLHRAGDAKGDANGEGAGKGAADGNGQKRRYGAPEAADFLKLDRIWREDAVEAARRVDAEGRKLTRVEREAWIQFVGKEQAPERPR